MQASLKNYRQAPRKVRLVTDLVKGKDVAWALTHLSFLSNKASEQIGKMIKSAAANARQNNESITDGDLIIKNITVDKGITYRRFRPRARGRASAIHKECSHVKVTLTERGGGSQKEESSEDTK